MNKEYIEKKIELYQAMLNGATIECQCINYDSEWGCSDHVMEDKGDFNFKLFKYRAVYPKLTKAVFDREDCPEWATLAVVGPGGYGCWGVGTVEPIRYGWFCTNSMGHEGACFIEIPGKFDASDWENSLIERNSGIHYQDYVFNCGNSRGAAVTTTNKDDVTCKNCLELLKKQSVENKLPDWCKVGTKVYVKEKVISDFPSFRGVGIQTIKEICGNNILITSPANDEVVSVKDHTYLCPAVYILPTIDDIFQRSSLVVKSKEKDPDSLYYTVTRSLFDGKVVFSSGGCFSIAELDKHFTWADGTSIGKWVKVAE